jgi:hypothetical protein
VLLGGGAGYGLWRFGYLHKWLPGIDWLAPPAEAPVTPENK